MRITVMGVLIVIGGALLLALITFVLLGSEPKKTGKGNERPHPTS